MGLYLSIADARQRGAEAALPLPTACILNSLEKNLAARASPSLYATLK